MQNAPFKVYMTKDYSKFRHLLGNRDVSEQRIKRIIESIQQIGFLNSAIIVNERMEVIDGQARLEALKRLQLPVYYCIHNGAGVEECLLLNQKQKNWSCDDYCKSYMEQGNENYHKLIALTKALNGNAGITYYIAKNIVSNHGATKIINGGKVEISDSEYNRAVNNKDFIQLVRTKLNENGLTSKRLLMTAFNYAYNVKEADQKRLMFVVKNRMEFIKPYATVEMTLSNISEVYNSHLSGNRIAFDAIHKMENL